MLVEVSLKSFQLLAQLPSAKIVEHYNDAAPVVELGDNKRYYCSIVNLECMDSTNELRCFSHRDILVRLGISINNSIIYSSYNSKF